MGSSIEERIDVADKNEAVRACAARVSGEALTLYGNEPVPLEAWVAFTFTLQSGEVFLEGMGRCESVRAMNDGRQAVRLASLQFDALNELMFERLQIEGEGSPTGEIDLNALEAQRAPRPSPSMSPAVLPPPRTDAHPSWRPPPTVARPPRRSAPPTVRRPAFAGSHSPSGTPSPLKGSVGPSSPSMGPRPRPMVEPTPIAPGDTASSESPMPCVPSSPPAPRVPIHSSVVRSQDDTSTGFPAPAPIPAEAKESSVEAEPEPSATPEDASMDAATRARLEPLLPAMRRAGSARHVEDAHRLATELGLSMLEKIFS